MLAQILIKVQHLSLFLVGNVLHLGKLALLILIFASEGSVLRRRRKLQYLAPLFIDHNSQLETKWYSAPIWETKRTAQNSISQ